MLKNRIEKNWNKLKAWSKQSNVEAFRLYDRDIPEFQIIIDKYKDFFVVYDKTNPYLDQDKNIEELSNSAITSLFKPEPQQIIWKSRERQSGTQQYEKLAETNKSFFLNEGSAKFKVNLWDYLDTGLFLDHRPLRHKLSKQSQGKSLLNLFCYTGSISVAAALGGASTTSIDMSATYLDWAAENLKENNLPLDRNELIRADVLTWLKESPVNNQFDIIFLDPPTFSNSKKMEQTFEVERDQDFLIPETMKHLKSDGVLYFSNNKRKFRLNQNFLSKYEVKDISKETIPRDFHDLKIHQCFEFRWKK